MEFGEELGDQGGERRQGEGGAAIEAGMPVGEVLGHDYDELREAAKARILAETMQEAERHA